MLERGQGVRGGGGLGLQGGVQKIPSSFQLSYRVGGGEGYNLIEVSPAKVYVGPLVDLPCGTQPPTESCWTASTQRRMPSRRSGKEGRVKNAPRRKRTRNPIGTVELTVPKMTASLGSGDRARAARAHGGGVAWGCERLRWVWRTAAQQAVPGWGQPRGCGGRRLGSDDWGGPLGHGLCRTWGLEGLEEQG